MKARGLFFLIWILASLPVLAADGHREQRIYFKAGTAGVMLRGRLQGRETLDYLIGAHAGQQMAVTLHADHPQTCFNILPPGSREVVLFTGCSAANHFASILPASGDYRIRVYLTRAAAQRNEATRYRLDVQIGRVPQAHLDRPAGALADGLASEPDPCLQRPYAAAP